MNDDGRGRGPSGCGSQAASGPVSGRIRSFGRRVFTAAGGFGGSFAAGAELEAFGIAAAAALATTGFGVADFGTAGTLFGVAGFFADVFEGVTARTATCFAAFATETAFFAAAAADFFTAFFAEETAFAAFFATVFLGGAALGRDFGAAVDERPFACLGLAVVLPFGAVFFEVLLGVALFFSASFFFPVTAGMSRPH